MARVILLVGIFSLSLAACAGEPETAPADDGPGEIEDPEDPIPETPAVLEIYALDIWAQPLPSDAKLEIVDVNTDQSLAIGGFPVGLVGLDEAGVYRISLSAPDHAPLDVVVEWSGGADGSLQLREATEGHGVSLSHDVRSLAPARPTKPVHTVYLGLRHNWFSAEGRPARRGNEVTLLMDGEEAWSSVHADLSAATDKISLSTWWWDSGFELLRNPATHVSSTEYERRQNTILGLLDASPATKRVLVGQFISQDGLLSSFTVDAPLVDRGEAAGDKFEYMGQANETAGIFTFTPDAFSFADRVKQDHADVSDRAFDAETMITSTIVTREVDLEDWPVNVEVQHASWHQKFMVIDSELAYIGGMNLRKVDWDTSEHLVFEPRRMLVDSSFDDRKAVEDLEAMPDNGPRKDYMTRIEGPSAQDAADVFSVRWELARTEGAEYWQNSSSFEIERNIPERPAGVQAQVTATMPDPLWEHAIAETWMNAVNNATDYIYVEDQYFRAPMLFDAIAARMRAVPSLKLIVITKPVSEWTDPGCAWTSRAHELFSGEFPDRYAMLQLRAFATQVTWGIDETDAHFQNIDVHSKMLMVDDIFMSIGSANKNNRGMVYEGELNLAVVDRSWVAAQRRRIIANLLPAGSPALDAAAAWMQQLRDAAGLNQNVYDAWDAEGFDISLDGDALPANYQPKGFVYPLHFRTVDDCLLEDVGADMV